MGIRIIAALLATLCGAFYGMNRSEKLKKRMLLCTEADKVFRLCETMIRSSGTDIYRIITVLKRENYTALRFIYRLSEEYSADSDFHSEWRELLLAETYIPQEERGILLDFGEVLGTSDIAGQLSSIASQRSLMQECYERSAMEYHGKARFYRSVGVLAGVMAGIMVI